MLATHAGVLPRPKSSALLVESKVSYWAPSSSYFPSDVERGSNSTFRKLIASKELARSYTTDFWIASAYTRSLPHQCFDPRFHVLIRVRFARFDDTTLP